MKPNFVLPARLIIAYRLSATSGVSTSSFPEIPEIGTKHETIACRLLPSIAFRLSPSRGLGLEMDTGHGLTGKVIVGDSLRMHDHRQQLAAPLRMPNHPALPRFCNHCRAGIWEKWSSRKDGSSSLTRCPFLPTRPQSPRCSASLTFCNRTTLCPQGRLATDSGGPASGSCCTAVRVSPSAFVAQAVRQSQPACKPDRTPSCGTRCCGKSR